MSEILFKIDSWMEMSLLGSILIRNDILDEKAISRDLFYSLEDLAIFDKITELHAQGFTVIPEGLALLLPERHKDIDQCRQLATLDVDEVIKRLQENKMQRGTVSLYSSLHDMLKDDVPAAEILETVSSQVSLLIDAQSTSYKTASEVIVSTIKEIEERAQQGSGLSGVPSGFPQLDDWTDGFQNGDYIIVGARPSVGKTSFALAVMLKALTKNHRPAFFSFEMTSNALMKRIFGIMTTVTIREMQKGRVSQAQIQELKDAAVQLVTPTEKLFFGNDRGMNIDSLVIQARRLKHKEKVDVIFVDYFGLIASSGKNKKRWEEASEISNRLKSFAMELNVPVIVLSQLGREAEGKKPTLANLRDSGSLEQDADIVILLHATENKPTELQLILAKHRQGETGQLDLYFNKAHQTFAELEQGSSYVDKD
jgi:replicative DNA helicase